MGTSYDNITLKKTNQAATASYLNQIGMHAFVSPPTEDVVVVYCWRNDSHIAARLSQNLDCIALFASVFDGWVFRYELYECGDLTDRYESFPSTFDEIVEIHFPFDEHAKKLCRAFEVPEAEAQVTAILIGWVWQSGRQVILGPEVQHEALREALGLRGWSGDWKYDSIQLYRDLESPQSQSVWWQFIETGPQVSS